MHFYYLIIVFLCGCSCQNVVNNVRVVNHIGYVIDVVTETVQQVEKRGWWNLRVPDVTVEVDEVALNLTAKGTVHYKNGFVATIEAVDLLQSSVQSQVNLNSNQQAQAILRGTLRMHNVAIGYEVEADMEDGTQHYTATYVHPMINFAFTITKIIDHDGITVTVVGTIPTSRNLVTFMPANKLTDVFTTLFDNTMSNDAVNAWGPTIFAPITTEIVSTQIDFPTLCYNCSA